MRVLAAVDTVHTAAALCDDLAERLGPDDEVVFVAVHPPEPAVDSADTDAVRDRREALNVASVRLAVPAVETVEREGGPVEQLLAAAAEREVDEIVVERAGTVDAGSAAVDVGRAAGDAGGADAVGTTAAAVRDAASVPVTIVQVGDA